MMQAAIDLAALRLEMLAHGYHPVPVLKFDANDKAAGKRPTLVGWETVCATADEAEIRRWSEDHGQRNCLNTGLLCGSVVGLDFDIPDYALACRINALADAMLPPTPLLRIGRSPKSLRVFRAEHVPHHSTLGMVVSGTWGTGRFFSIVRPSCYRGRFVSRKYHMTSRGVSKALFLNKPATGALSAVN
jgi:hypothetical protein